MADEKKIVPFSEGEISLDNLGAALANAKQEITISDGLPFLKLSREGEWQFGVDAVVVEDGSMWAFNPLSLKHGFISWGEAEVLGEEMVSINQPRPDVNNLKKTGEKWSEQVSVQLCCIEGADKDVQVLYKTTSVGGKNAMAKYLAAVQKQIAVDATKVVAVCKLESDFYTHKKFGKIHTPKLVIQHFVDMDGVA